MKDDLESNKPKEVRINLNVVKESIDMWRRSSYNVDENEILLPAFRKEDQIEKMVRMSSILSKSNIAKEQNNSNSSFLNDSKDVMIQSNALKKELYRSQ